VKNVRIAPSRLQYNDPVRGDQVGRSIKSAGLLARDTNQAMNRRMKLNDALGKMAKK
jgi:hypothetical protein